jgi:membrane protease YdiL (CAAX protease family)
MNILYNKSEKRFRAGVRLTGFLFLTIVFVAPTGLVPIKWLSTILISISCLLATFLAIKGIDYRRMSDIGLSINKIWWKEFVLGILIAFFAQTIIFSLEYGFSWIEFTGYGWERAGSETWIWSAVTYFLTMLSVGFYEELIFRAYPVKNIAEGFTIGSITPEKATFIAVFLTSIIFGVAHAGNPNATSISTFNIVLAGVMLAVPFVLTGRLALSIGIHFSWNWVMGGVYGLPVSGLNSRRSILQTNEIGPDLWTGGNFGPEAGLLGLIAMVFILICVFAYSKKINSNKLELHEIFTRDYENK